MAARSPLLAWLLVAMLAGSAAAQVGHSVVAESCDGTNWSSPGVSCGGGAAPGGMDYSALPLSDYVKYKTMELGTQMLGAMAAQGLKRMLNGDPEAEARRAQLRAQEEERQRQQRERELQRRRQILQQLLSGQDRLGALALRFGDGKPANIGQIQLTFGNAGAPGGASADNKNGYGIAGLPGVYTGGSRSGQSYGINGLPGANLQGGGAAASSTGGGYGIPGLPGTYTGGARQEQFSTGDSAGTPAEAKVESSRTSGEKASGGFGIAGLSDPQPAAPPAAANAPANDLQISRMQDAPAAAPTEASAAKPSNEASANVAPQANRAAMSQLRDAAASSKQAATAGSLEEAADQASAPFDRGGEMSAARSSSMPVPVSGAAAGDPCAGTSDGAVNLRCASTTAVDPKRVRGEQPVAAPRVEPQNVQLAAALVGLAKNASPANRQVAVQQALDTANGDNSIQAQSPAQLPPVDAQGLRAFQLANDRYRRATDSRLQAMEKFKQQQERRETAAQILALVDHDFEQAAQADQATLEKKRALLAKVFADARKEDEALNVAAARIDLSDLAVIEAKRDAEYVLRGIADKSALQLSQPGDVELLFPPQSDEPPFLFPDLDGPPPEQLAAARRELALQQTYIGSPQDADLDLLFVDAGEGPRYIALDADWKLHANNVRAFAHDPQFRQAAWDKWHEIVNARETAQRNLFREYTARQIDLIQRADLLRDPAGLRAVENSRQQVVAEMNAKLAGASRQAVHDWLSWLNTKEMENAGR